MDFSLDTIIYGEITLKHVLFGVGGLVCLSIVIGFFKKLFAKKDEVAPHMQVTRCSSCGWQGQVSRHAGKCPKCNSALGDRKSSS